MSITTEQSPPSPFRESDPFGTRELVVAYSPDASVEGRVIALGPSAVAFGREVSPPSISIADSQMSRVHFRIAFDRRGSLHRLGDAESMNGTYVGGRRIDSVALSPGDVIRAGETTFVYRTADPMAAVRDTIDRVAATNLSVLIVGETGTGKELLARAVHEKSGRPGPFVPINCAALPRELAATEFFGHTRGAFSGAVQARAGMFQTAHTGTLFLDEVKDLPADLQPLLLRALQEKSVRPVGGDREVAVDVRVVAAAQPHIEEAVQEERFRGDLYARLAQAVVVVPRLKERRAEVLSLARAIAAKGGRPLSMTPDAAEALARYDWPFNVRELESVIMGHAALSTEGSLGLEYLKQRHPLMAEDFRGAPAPGENKGPGRKLPSRRELDELVRKHLGNVAEMARETGKPRSQIYRWLRASGIDPALLRKKPPR